MADEPDEGQPQDAQQDDGGARDAAAQGQGQPAPDAAAAPSDPAAAAQEEELRRRLEEELRRLRVEDVLLQSVVSLINLTSRRSAKPDERDLEQARLGIDAIRALADFLPEEASSQVRQALSELQVAYASEAGGSPAPGAAAGKEGGGSGPGAPSEQGRPSEQGPPGEQGRPGEQGPPGEQGSSGLWTPHDRSS